MTAPRDIRFENVSKFYGEVLGVNRVELTIPPGITSLVGPNGSGKTTLMNLMTGLLQPSSGRIQVLGLDLTDRERLFREVGYCTQYDSFPRGVNGWNFLISTLRLHGHAHGASRALAQVALERVNLVKEAGRAIAGYSKGMRQRVKLAQAICHQPSVLVLDEPLNGLDPLARAEVIELFREWAGAGLHLIISSHILHEVDMISDQVVILSSGYVVAEGSIRAMRTEVKSHPLQILIRCANPGVLASRLFEESHIVEVKMHDDRGGLLVRTSDAEACWRLLNRVVLERGIQVDTMAPNDDDVHSLYDYLIGEGESAA